MSEPSFRIKPWVLVLCLIALSLVVFNYDPIGDVLNKTFGKGADKWAVNIVIVALIIGTFFRRKKG
jgi:hypothetical protein